MDRKYMVAGSTLGVVMLAAPFAYAETGESEGRLDLRLNKLVRLLDEKPDKTKSAEVHATSSVTVRGTVTAINGTTILVQGKDAASYTIQAGSAVVKSGTLADIRVGDEVKIKGSVNDSVIVATRIDDDKLERRRVEAKLENLRVGIVTSVSPNSFTIARFGSGTTTVSTSASTTVKTHGKNATSSIAVGSRVVVAGTSTEGSTMSAQIVLVFGKGFGWLKSFFFR